MASTLFCGHVVIIFDQRQLDWQLGQGLETAQVHIPINIKTFNYFFLFYK